MAEPSPPASGPSASFDGGDGDFIAQPPPAPAARAVSDKTGPVPAGAADESPKKDPTRYGDWEKNGRCIDF